MLFAKRRMKKNGQRATATVISCEERSKVTSNELRDYDYVLEVQPETGEAFEAKVRDKFWITGLRPKELDDDVPVRFDPSSKETVFDLDGDPRYDVDAMNARTAQIKAETRELKQKHPD